VAAKRLHRHWIGVESHADYLDLARQRIADVEPVPYDPDLFEIPNPRKTLREDRIPFGMLLEYNLLQPGQLLYLTGGDKVTARILADGSLLVDGQRGSIHQTARQFCGSLNLPCNGWEQWYYFDPQTGERQPINRLREQLRQVRKLPRNIT
jgi:modification methylase